MRLSLHSRPAHLTPLNTTLFAVTRNETADRAQEQYFSDAVFRRITDFPDLFTTNPELVNRGIGLQPQALADFRLNRGEEDSGGKP